MNYEVIGITVLWSFLFGYVIIASIDFGAGFFMYYSSITNKKHVIHPIIERYLSPVWEITNVFLVFFFVGIIGFFPEIAYVLGTALLIPGSIAIVLIAIRGSYYAFNHYGHKTNKVYSFLYGATGLLIPAAWSTVLTISEGGYIAIGEDGKVTFLAKQLFTSLYSWSVVVLAIVSVLYISAMFLCYYAHIGKDSAAFDIVRKYALAWSIPTILSSLFVFFAIYRHNNEHFNRMLDMGWMFAASLICFMFATGFIYFKKQIGLSFVFVILQFGFAFFGYGRAHLPYIVYPHISIDAHFTNDAMAIALIIAFIFGFVLLIPSLYLVLKLFIFDASYVRGKR